MAGPVPRVCPRRQESRASQAPLEPADLRRSEAPSSPRRPPGPRGPGYGARGPGRSSQSPCSPDALHPRAPFGGDGRWHSRWDPGWSGVPWSPDRPPGMRSPARLPGALRDGAPVGRVKRRGWRERDQTPRPSAQVVGRCPARREVGPPRGWRGHHRAVRARRRSPTVALHLQDTGVDPRPRRPGALAAAPQVFEPLVEKELQHV